MKWKLASCALIIFCILCACGVSKNNEVKKEKTIVFADEVFEGYTRQIIGKLNGDITYEDLMEIKQVRFGIEWIGVSYQPYDNEDAQFTSVDLGNWQDIVLPKSMEDLQYFVGVESLDLPYVPIKNLSFAKSMPNLKSLIIDDSPNDLKSLQSCAELRYIDMDFSQVTDISPLKKLDKLEKIWASGVPEETIDKWRKELPNVEIN